jgi:hypothetical protein
VLEAVARTRSDDGGTSPSEDGRWRRDRAAPSTVIAVFARAKLLGLKILTIDARVVIAPDTARDVASVAARTRVVSPSAHQPVQRVGKRADLAQAVRLLEEGSKSLDEVRGMRSLDSRAG